MNTMTVKDYLEGFLLENPHPHETATMLKWLNLCESNVDVKKTYINQYYAKTINAFQFTLPTGVDIEDVANPIYVNGIKYKKKDPRAYKELRTFWYENGKLCMYPACDETDIAYVSGGNEITFASSTITTTGADFSGLVVGDTILVSGCLLNTSNNKPATIVGIAAKVLTFASGTFAAQAEAAAITVQKVSIKVPYLSKPATKLIANIATDTLYFGDRWLEIYDFFLMSKVAYLAKNYQDSANHMAMFNNKVAEYDNYWENVRPMQPENSMVAET
jgi:hypothetical protein